ncbi:serine O-acetyltransferase [Psychrobium sp. 1_MG-2023]|uniref:serine O-acetyltransferase n=1 Tax=Psychrobium sp. 1_MG-2023 TaxID=3062624 RepID=UPI000C31FAE3|nr:serine O-acetyltransferase [Psychrobium sp. 1_MG-2023]MDP2562262.1 serine O-acetyltransferase [Psychrobium sp. 1_MG-2023]PKF57512.1 serine O-acetyltransferase [Alteromonadales bacterium alter-6D02]
MNIESLWDQIVTQAEQAIADEPLLTNLYRRHITDHNSLSSAISNILSSKLYDTYMPASSLEQLFNEAFNDSPQAISATARDIEAVRERDPAIQSYPEVLLHLKGFMALQSYRVAHHLWQNNRHQLALYVQSRISETFDVDIHPAACVGKGVMLDHANGIVIGETSVIEDNVSILQGVTLGGTGKESGDRHPKVRAGVLIGAGSKILGNIEIGQGAKIGAGSVVLKAVAPHTTVAGVPAKQIGSPESIMPALDMCQNLEKELASDGKTPHILDFNI